MDHELQAGSGMTWVKLSPGIWEHSGEIYAMAQMVALTTAVGGRPGYGGMFPGRSESEVERIAAEIVEKRRNGDTQ